MFSRELFFFARKYRNILAGRRSTLRSSISTNSQATDVKMPRDDPRCVIGTRVQAKACHVTALAECHRRYGARAKTQLVQGTVIEVLINPPTPTARSETFVHVDFNLGGGTNKTTLLTLRKVKLAEAKTPTIQDNEPATELGTENVEGGGRRNASFLHCSRLG